MPIDFDLLKYTTGKGSDDPPQGATTDKKAILSVKPANGTDPSIVKTSKAITDTVTQNQEKLTNEHSLITNGGIFFPANTPELFEYTPFSQDPFRQSMGSMFVQYDVGQLDVVRNAPIEANYKWSDSTADSPKSFIEENKKYLTPKNYYNANIVKFSVSGRTRINKETVPIFNFADIFHVKLYYGQQEGSLKDSIGGDNNPSFNRLKLDLLSLFFTVDQKMEGYTYNAGSAEQSLDIQFLSKASGFGFDSVMSDENNQIVSSIIGSYSSLPDVVKSIAAEVLKNIEDTVYYDHTFRADAAISEETVPLFGEELGQNTLIADIKPVYNFFSRKYEDAQIPETAAANIYINPNIPAQGKILVPGGAVGKPTVFVDTTNFEKYGSAVIQNCVDKDILQSQQFSRKNSIIVFDSESKLLNNRAEDAKEQFPFYNTIEFKPDSNRAVSTMMRQHGILDDFIKSLITKYYGSTFSLKYGTEESVETIGKQIGFALAGVLIPNQPFSVVSKIKDPASFDFFDEKDETYVRNPSFFQYDFTKWLEYYIYELKTPNLDDLPFTLFDDSFVNGLTRFFVGEKSDLSQAAEVNTKFDKMINLLMFLPKYKKFVEQQSRTFADLLGAGKCYSETLFYRVEKTDQEGNVVQQIFITKPEEADIVKYIDTQVQYGKKYEYNIVSYQLVIGSKYQYKFANDKPSLFDPTDVDLLASSDPSGPYYVQDGATIYTDEEDMQFSVYSKFQTIGGSKKSVDDKLSIFGVSMQPDVRIIEVPYHKESDVVVLDSPPLTPIVNFYPIHEKKNDILISFETQTGDIEQKPVSILDEDDKFFELERIQQKRTLQYTEQGDGAGAYSGKKVYVYPNLRFKSDDFSSEYQVFRIANKKPTSYKDFKGNLYQILNVNERTAFVDKIQTNTKYYYTFRSRDLHGNISNPSPVYEFEMVDNSGTVYPVISVVDMETGKESTYDMTKSMNRYLQIDASAIQSYLNEEKSGLNGATAINETIDPVLGLSEVSLWNQKRFKIRLRSRSTGKAIDLNVGFKTRHDKQSIQNTEICD
jgi:hypothetical protein